MGECETQRTKGESNGADVKSYKVVPEIEYQNRESRRNDEDGSGTQQEQPGRRTFSRLPWHPGS